MSDLISRQAAIDAWKEDFKGFVNSLDVLRDDYKGIMEYIDELPSADRPQGEWIPCSERLPQYRDVVLISTFWGVRVAERDGIKEDGTDDFWYLFLNDATAHPRYVYAWMPLPEPWKGADDERL